MIYIIEAAIAAGFLIILATQVIWPLLAGTPTFPLLRFREQEDALGEVTIDIERTNIAIQEEEARLKLLELKKRVAAKKTQRETLDN